MSLVIFTHPINLKLFGFIRPMDIILIGVSLVLIVTHFRPQNVNRRLFVYIALFTISLVASIAYGLLTRGIVTKINFVFFFKYVSVFVFFWSIGVLTRVLNQRQIELLFRFMFIVMAILVINMLFIIWYPVELIHNLKTHRPYFLFTSHYADSHNLTTYYSNLLTGALALIWFGVIKQFNKKHYYLVLAISFPILIIPGSRSGVIVFCLTLLVLYAESMKNYLLAVRISKIKVGLILVAICLAVFTFAKSVDFKSGINELNSLRFENSSVNRFYANIKRSFTYKGMAGARLEKIERAFKDVFVDGPVVIGIGAPSSKMIWLDNGVASIVLNAGASGLVLMSLMLFEYLRTNRKKALQNNRYNVYQALFILTANYVLTNVIVGEFFLTTRAVVPFIVFSCLLVAIINSNQLSNELDKKTEDFTSIAQ